MDAIVYVNKPLKKINGTLFYCFEYFVFLKKYIPHLKFIFLYDSSGAYFRDVDDSTDIEYFKNIFKEKYDFKHRYLDDIVAMKPLQFMQSSVENVMMFDVHSYKVALDYFGRTKNVLLYCNKPEGEEYLNVRPERDTFYGWYEKYQFFNKKTRLKMYREMHKVSARRGDKVFITSPNANNIEIAKSLNLNIDSVYTKEPNKHITNLFEKISKIVYWHSGSNDANNRMIVEAFIHNIPIEIYDNGFKDDSVYDRKVLIEQSRTDELMLTEDDVMIQDFLNICQTE